MIKVSVEVEEMWTWWPETEFNSFVHPQLEVEESLIEEYNDLKTRWLALQDKLEQLYRIQAGLKPNNPQSVPNHTIL